MRFFHELKQACPTLSVGVITADLMHLEEEINRVEQAGVRLLHFDVMDGRFCPLLTFGPWFVKALRTSLLKDVHLLVEESLERIEGFAAAGADIITVNVESCRHLHRALQMIGRMKNSNDEARGILRGVSLNPSTPVEVIEPVMEEVEMVLLLGVNPGFGGERFIGSVRRKVSQVRAGAEAAGKEVLICLDGGVKKENISELAGLGADILVTGRAVYDGKDPGGNAAWLLQRVKEAGHGK